MAHFMLRHGEYHAPLGTSGKAYAFLAGQPVEVSDPRDIWTFQNQRDVFVEVDPKGASIEALRDPDAGTNRPPAPSLEMQAAAEVPPPSMGEEPTRAASPPPLVGPKKDDTITSADLGGKKVRKTKK